MPRHLVTIALSAFFTWLLVSGSCNAVDTTAELFLSSRHDDVIQQQSDPVTEIDELLVALSYIAQQRYAEAGLFLERPLTEPATPVEHIVRSCGMFEILIRSGKYNGSSGIQAACREATSRVDAEGPRDADARLVLSYGLHVLGYADQTASRYEESLSRYFEALDANPGNSRIAEYFELNTRNNMGNVYWRTGRSSQALDVHLDVYRRRVELLGGEHPKTGGTIGNLGNVFHSLGEYEKALYFHERAADIWKARAGAFDPEYAYAVNNGGLALIHLERDEEAIEALSRSLRIKRAVHGDSSATLINTLANLTTLYIRNGDREAAHQHADLVSAIARRHGLESTPGLWVFEVDRSRLMVQEGRVDEATDALDYALWSARAAMHPVAFRLANRLATVLLEAGHAESAKRYLEWVDTCVRTCTWSPVSDSVLTSNPPAEESISLWLEANRLLLDVGGEHARERAELAARTAERIQSDSWSLKFDRQWYTQALDLHRALFEHAVGDNDLEKAWEHAEIIKNLFARRVSRHRESTEWSHEQMEELLAAESAMVRAERRGLEESRRALVAERVRLQLQFEQTVRLNASEDLPNPWLTLDEARAHARQREEAFLHFVWGSNQRVLHALIVRPDTALVVPVNQANGIAHAVDSLFQALSGNSRYVFEPAARHTSDVLLRPLLPWLDDHTLVISADENLFNVPFDLLPQPDVVEFRYMVESVALRYAISGTAWATAAPLLEISDAQPVRAAVMDVGFNRSLDIPLSTPDRQADTPLPGARLETASLLTLLRGQDLARVSYVRNVTTRLFERRMQSRHDIVHLATHSFFDQDLPHNSGIIMAAPAISRLLTDSVADILSPAELAGMQVEANLLVLSSCESALRTGGSSAAFDFGVALGLSGVEHALVSNWAVDDMATSEFMLRFYRELLSGLTPHEALRNAKLSFIREQSPLANPRMWAGFVLMTV